MKAQGNTSPMATLRSLQAVEKFKHDQAVELEAIKNENALNLERRKLDAVYSQTTASFAVGTFQALMLLNGGALTALLTYAGHLAKPSESAAFLAKDAVGFAVGAYIVGGLLAIFVGACGYGVQLRMRRLLWAQDADGRRRHRRRAEQWRILGFGFGIVSTVCFALGSGCALSALR